jgi:hypothetical protein
LRDDAAYDIFHKLNARDVYGEIIGEVGKDCDVQQIQKQLEPACTIMT